MEKRIFAEEEPSNTETYRAKQEFSETEVVVEPEERAEETPSIVDETLKPSRFWVRLWIGALVLFGLATLAQSIQWLVDTFQAKQWIYFAFAIAFFGISLAGWGAIISEWRKLVWLRRYARHKQASQPLLMEGKAIEGNVAKEYCHWVLANMQRTLPIEAARKRWESQLDDAYNSQEVLYLFNENVLQPIDKQVKKLISQSAAENAVIVAISPLAVIDVLMVAWRNIALVNKIARSYGMELGYFSRLRLFRMVLTNMVFAGATEVVSDVGMDFFSQNLTAKFSIRVAQGLGVGILTARLGIKAMEFCRPVVFMQNERPKLSLVRQELLGVLKAKLFRHAAEDEKAPEYR